MTLLEVCMMTYRKHHMGDDGIGWEELGLALRDALENELSVIESCRRKDYYRGEQEEDYRKLYSLLHENEKLNPQQEREE